MTTNATVTTAVPTGSAGGSQTSADVPSIAPGTTRPVTVSGDGTAGTSRPTGTTTATATDTAAATTATATAATTATTGPAATAPAATTAPATTPSVTEATAATTATATTATAPTTGPAATELPVAELPGGGYTLFPGRTLLALYGYPGSKALGALGQQDLPAAIARAKKIARQYERFVDGPVVPTFEIIATVASAGAGADGDYSSESTVAKLKPWVDAATDAGMYVILDLQPGRAHFLTQAKMYAKLLQHPNVGLALDPEWKLAPGQKPLQQIGGVEAAEVNSVIRWLAQLVADGNLPQKLLVLHQFQLAMLRDEHHIMTTDPAVQVLIHMDGQGSHGGKEATWRAVTGAAPDGVAFGWKNFFAMDRPMMTPAETVDRDPIPVMISYQ